MFSLLLKKLIFEFYLKEKCIVLLALLAMLRLSDIAPHTKLFDSKTLDCSSKHVFSAEQVRFNDHFSVTFEFQGIKNDTDRAGFEIAIRSSTDLLSVASPTGVHLLVFFCSSDPVVLFDTPGISRCRSQYGSVESTSLFHHSIYL